MKTKIVRSDNNQARVGDKIKPNSIETNPMKTKRGLASCLGSIIQRERRNQHGG